MKVMLVNEEIQGEARSIFEKLDKYAEDQWVVIKFGLHCYSGQICSAKILNSPGFFQKSLNSPKLRCLENMFLHMPIEITHSMP